MKKELKKYISEVIKIPSLSTHERSLADYIFTSLLVAGLKPQKQNGNVVVRIPGEDNSKALILNAHMDTIAPGALSLWKFPPYGKDAGMEQDGNIYGLGASDDKASIGTLLVLAEELKKTKPVIDVWLTFVREEGTGGAGSKSFLEWFTDNGWQEKYREISAVVCGPTYMNEVRIGHRGNFNAEITVKGSSGHGSEAHLVKKQAIPDMLAVIDGIKKLEKEWQKEYSDKVLGKPTIAVTSIKAGDAFAPTKLPDTCAITLDVRTTPTLDKKAFGLLEKCVKNMKAEIRIVYTPAPPGRTDPKEKIVIAAKKLVGKLGVGSDSTDLCFFTERGIPGIILGPGDSTVIHKPNEYCELLKAEKALQIYKELINLV